MVKYVDHDFIHPMDVILNDHMVGWGDDPYLDATRDEKLKLGQDVLEHGNYWPFTGNKELYIAEGCHRIYSLQKNYEEKEFDNRYLMFKHTMQFYYDLKAFEEEGPEAIDSFKKLYSTFDEYVYISDECLAFDHMRKKIRESKEKEIIKFDGFNYYKLKVTNIYEIFLSYVSIPILLRYSIHKQQKDGSRISTLPHINDELFFRRWKRELKEGGLIAQ